MTETSLKKEIARLLEIIIGYLKKLEISLSGKAEGFEKAQCTDVHEHFEKPDNTV